MMKKMRAVQVPRPKEPFELVGGKFRNPKQVGSE